MHVKKSKHRKSLGRKLIKGCKLKNASVSDAFCGKVVENPSELEEIFDDMVKSPLKWAGHVERMKDDRLPRMA